MGNLLHASTTKSGERAVEVHGGEDKKYPKMQHSLNMALYHDHQEWTSHVYRAGCSRESLNFYTEITFNMDVPLRRPSN